MKATLGAILITVALVTTAHAQDARRGEVDSFELHQVGRLAPVLRGVIWADNNQIETRNRVGFDSNAIGFVSFPSSYQNDSQSAAPRYLTAYLVVIDPNKLSPVTVSVGAYYPPLTTESIDEMRTLEAGKVTVAEIKRHLRRNCKPEHLAPNFPWHRLAPMGCKAMPVNIPYTFPLTPDDDGGYNEIYLFDNGGGQGVYVLNSGKHDNLINKGLGLSMTRLRPLAGAGEETCGGFKANIVSTRNAEVINGTKDGDVIVINSMNAIVYAGGGDDIICVNHGGARVFGQGGDDEIYGSRFIDVLIGGAGNDFLDGRGGMDICHGGGGADKSSNCEVNQAVERAR